MALKESGNSHREVEAEIEERPDIESAMRALVDSRRPSNIEAA